MKPRASGCHLCLSSDTTSTAWLRLPPGRLMCIPFLSHRGATASSAASSVTQPHSAAMMQLPACMHPTRKLLDAATSCSALSQGKRSNTSSHHLIGQVWVRCVLIQIPQGAGHPASSTKQAAQAAPGYFPWGHGARWNLLQAGKDLLPSREAALAQAEPRGEAA